MYKSMEEILRRTRVENRPFWEVVLLEDCKERDVTREDSFTTLAGMYRAMREADSAYDGELFSASGLSGGDGEKLRRAVQKGGMLCGNLIGTVMEKAVKMAEMMNIPIVGLVENMSYLLCPDCGREIPLFGQGRTQAAADAHHLPLLARMPIDPALAQLTDEGRIEDHQSQCLTPVIEAILQ